jgi:hypothetical protein
MQRLLAQPEQFGEVRQRTLVGSRPEAAAPFPPLCSSLLNADAVSAISCFSCSQEGPLGTFVGRDRSLSHRAHLSTSSRTSHHET